MALNKDFYDEIYKKEQKLIELIEKNLLNIYYINYSLNYKKKLEELTYEYNLTNNKMIGQTIEEIKVIINKIDELEEIYRKGNEINIKELLPLFLINKTFNNIEYKKTEIQTKKEFLQQLKNNYVIIPQKNEEEYLYDDFPDDVKVK